MYTHRTDTGTTHHTHINTQSTSKLPLTSKVESKPSWSSPSKPSVPCVTSLLREKGEEPGATNSRLFSMLSPPLMLSVYSLSSSSRASSGVLVGGNDLTTTLCVPTNANTSQPWAEADNVKHPNTAGVTKRAAFLQWFKLNTDKWCSFSLHFSSFLTI